MEKILEQILGELKDLKTGQERVENKIDSLRSSIVKDLTPYVENVEKHIEDRKIEVNVTTVFSPFVANNQSIE